MRVTRLKLIVTAGLLLASSVLLCSPASLSARLRHRVKRAYVASEMALSRWLGYESRLMSLTGEIGLAGAQVQALDSKSGWASLCDLSGNFTIRDVVWYPGASYELVISIDDRRGKKLKLDGPLTFPSDGVFNAGSLSLNDATDIDLERLPGAKLISFQRYDFENRDYYRKLYETLTAAETTHEGNIDAIHAFVSERLDYDENQQEMGSPRRVLEHGSQYCGQLSTAMATIASVGYATRTVDLRDAADPPNTHMVVEVFYKGEWHLYDPTYGASFEDQSGRVASYRELRLNPDLITEDAFSSFRKKHSGSPLEWMRKIYGSGYHHYYSLTFKCSQFCHAWWAYSDGLSYVPSGGRIWLAAAGICPGTRVVYHIRIPGGDKDDLSFSTQGTGNSVCVLNQELSPQINLGPGAYEVFVDLQDGNVLQSDHRTPVLISDSKLSVLLKVK